MLNFSYICWDVCVWCVFIIPLLRFQLCLCLYYKIALRYSEYGEGWFFTFISLCLLVWVNSSIYFQVHRFFSWSSHKGHSISLMILPQFCVVFTFFIECLNLLTIVILNSLSGFNISVISESDSDVCFISLECFLPLNIPHNFFVETEQLRQ